MSRVCRLTVDPDRFQAYAPSSPAPEFKGAPLGNLDGVILTPVNPKAQRSDFYALWTDAAFACNKVAGEALARSIQSYGELLPAEVVSGPQVLVFNCTNVIDCLDDRRTRWKIGERSGERLWVLEYVFRTDRLPSIGEPFKIPQVAMTELFIVDDPTCRPASSFYSQVEIAGLRGIELKPLSEFASLNPG